MKTSNGRIMLFYQKIKCVIAKNQNFLKNKRLVSNLSSNWEASKLLSNLARVKILTSIDLPLINTLF